MAATIIISGLLLVMVSGIIVSMVRNKKKGKSACGCGGCDCCPSDDICHK
ncbi:MAG: hypothetical protein H6Q60_1207 [Oscillospiraceae bacterium]|nr:hypothetical protein [Oscillospiraceae bacterium]